MSEEKYEDQELGQKEGSELETLTPEDTSPDYGGILADWHFAESATHQRGRLWYIIFSLIVVALLVFSYFSKNPTFAVILVLGLIIYIITEKRGPTIFHLLVTEDGLIINDKFTSYEDLDSFYIIYFPPQIKNLYIQPKGSWRQIINIHLSDQNPVEIRRLLLKYLREDIEKEEMPLSDGLIHRLKL
ncbi:MAG: hypothetical protein C3F02_02620 [Parcubacteria group bacterium]|nr:MAG: hypothetical protein C3F02_02620 [Parcubacteria group bacterium]